MRRWPAGLVAPAVIAGVDWSLQAVWCPAVLAASLLALGWSLRGTWGCVTAALGLGLLVGGATRDANPPPESDRPVTVVARVGGDWLLQVDGARVSARGEWLQQGIRIRRWHQRLIIVLPRGSEPPSSSRLRIRGYLRRAPAAANGERTHPGLWILRAKSMHFVASERPAPILQTWVQLSVAARGLIESRLAITGAGPTGPGRRLVRALVLGQASELPVSWRRGLRAAGLSHLVALSGLHVGLLAAGGFLLCAGATLRWRLMVVTLLLLFYLLVAGPRPSLMRACLMFAAVGAAWLIKRPPVPINILAVVATVMVLISPPIVNDVGFQLTVSATAGIVLLSSRLERRWSRIPGPLRMPLSVSVAAHLGALPWSLPIFHLLTPLSPIWNLLAVPWTAITLIVAVIWVILLITLPQLAIAIEPTLDVLGQPFAWVAVMRPELLGPIPVHLGAGSSLALTALLAVALLSRHWLWFGLGTGLVSLLVFHGTQSARVPELIVLDVGQGEAILLRDGTTAVLVDGGGWRRADIAQRVLLPTLSRFGIRRLDAVFLTHPDQDHCGGLVDLASYIPIGQLYTPPGWGRSPCVQELLGRPALRVRALWRGEETQLGEWSLTTLHPAAGDRRGRNHRSLVLLARVRGHQVLLTGDLGAIEEREVLRVFPRQLGDTEILKVGHHGSSGSTGMDWLTGIRPRLALISCGLGNPYGHPSPEVLRRLEFVGARVMRTDSHGLIRLLLPPCGPLRVLLPGAPRGWAFELNSSEVDCRLHDRDCGDFRPHCSGQERIRLEDCRALQR